MPNKKIPKTYEYDIRASFKINRKCNFRCPYCFHKKLWDKEKKDVDFDKSIDFFNKTDKTWFIQLSGGEPFIYPKFIELCKELTKKHFISFNTNLSSPKVNKFIKEVNPNKVGGITCSIQYPELERLNLKQNFIKKIKSLKKAGFHLDTNCVMWPPVLKRVDELFKEFIKEGIYPKPTGFIGIYTNKKYPEAYTEEESKTMKNYLNLFHQNQKKPEFILKQKNLNLPKKTITGNLQGSLSFYGIPCYAGKNHIIILQNGDVRKCHSDTKILGNIFQNNVKLFNAPVRCNILKCLCFYEGLNNALGEPRLIKGKKDLIKIRIGDLNKRLNSLKTKSLNNVQII